jgi:hypothetical protein
MDRHRFDILWHGLHFQVAADSRDEAAERVRDQLAADGIVAHAWQMRIGEIDDKSEFDDDESDDQLAR